MTLYQKLKHLIYYRHFPRTFTRVKYSKGVRTESKICLFCPNWREQ